MEFFDYIKTSNKGARTGLSIVLSQVQEILVRFFSSSIFAMKIVSIIIKPSTIRLVHRQLLPTPIAPFGNNL